MKYKVTLNGVSYEVEVSQGDAILVDEYTAVAPAAPIAVPTLVAAPASAPVAAPAQTASVSGEVVASPMPGLIVKVLVEVGQSVKKGDKLLVLEAMKMENEIVAPRDAAIGQIIVKAGANVDTGAPLLTLK